MWYLARAGSDVIVRRAGQGSTVASMVFSRYRWETPTGAGGTTSASTMHAHGQCSGWLV